MKLSICEIVIPPNRKRMFSESKANELAQSIREVGLLHPVIVTKDKVLVSGLHRLEACKLLNWTEIDCIEKDYTELDAELAEIDENLIRAELTVLERSEHLRRRKEIYEAKYPEARAYSSEKQRLRRKQEPDEIISPGFTIDTASKLGVSPRTVQQEVQIAENLTDKVKEFIKDTPIIDRKTDLLNLSRMSPEEQEQVAEVIASKEASTLTEAKNVIESKKPHVSYNSGNNEWYTPSEYIEVARNVMGRIDLDPASSEIANKTVQAGRFFTVQDDGLKQKWSGKVWMNPPYSSELIGHFCSKLTEHYANGDVTEAIVLVNNATETAWFSTLIEKASAVVFPRGRVKFITPNGETGAPLQGQAVIYLGNNPDKFLERFKCFGWGAYLCSAVEK